MLLTMIVSPWIATVLLVLALCRVAGRDEVRVEDDGDRALR
jgi:hypothetical protein